MAVQWHRSTMWWRMLTLDPSVLSTSRCFLHPVPHSQHTQMDRAWESECNQDGDLRKCCCSSFFYTFFFKGSCGCCSLKETTKRENPLTLFSDGDIDHIFSVARCDGCVKLGWTRLAYILSCSWEQVSIIASSHRVISFCCIVPCSPWSEC